MSPELTALSRNSLFAKLEAILQTFLLLPSYFFLFFPNFLLKLVQCQESGSSNKSKRYRRFPKSLEEMLVIKG